MDMPAIDAYHAFISYSHAVDGRLAPRLQSAVRRFASPWYRRSPLRLFRDQTNLSISPGLWSSIEAALSSSRYLILLASPQAAASKWVRREIQYWLEHKSPQTLLIVLTEGRLEWSDARKDFDWTRTDALPDSLAGSLPEEPLYLDLRGVSRAEDLAQGNPAFRDTVAALAATLLGRQKDELIGEDIAIRRRARRTVGAAGLLLAAMTVLLAMSTRFALSQRDSLAQSLRIVQGQKLAAQAQLVQARSPTELQLGALLALEAARLAPSAESRAQLREAISLLMPAVRQFPIPANDVPNAFLSAVAYSPDGQSVATTGVGPAPLWWDLATGNEIRKFSTPDVDHISPGSDVVFAPDGSEIITASGQQLIFWDTVTGGIARSVQAPATIRSLAISPDGRYLATGDYDGFVRVIRRADGGKVMLGKHAIIVNDVAFSPDGSLLASGSNDKTVRIWSLPDGRELRSLPHQIGVIGVAFSPDGKFVATGGWEGLARIWEVSSGRQVASFIHRGAIKAVAFSSDGKRLASAGDDGTARIWDRVTSREVARATLDAEATGVVFSNDGHGLAIASRKTVSVWKTIYGDEITQLPHPDDIVVSAAFSPDQQRLVTAAGNSARVWDVSGGRELYRLNHAAGSEVADVHYAPDGKSIVSIASLAQDARTCVSVWETESGTRRSEACHEHSAATISDDGGYVVTGNRGTVVVGDVMTGKNIASIDSIAETDFQSSLALSPRRHYVAIAAHGEKFDEYRLHIVALDSAAQPQSIPLDSYTRQVVFSPDERLIAAATQRGVGLWEVADGRQVGRFPLSADMSSIAFSADGRHLATAGRDQTVRVWEIPAFTEVARFELGGVVSRVVFSPDMEMVAAASSDRTARVWRWKTDPVTEACARLSRNLTRTEWQTYLGAEPYRPSCPGR